MEQQEIWKDIDGYDSRYQVSNLGQVRSRVVGDEWRLLRRSYRGGYYAVSLYKDGRRKTCLVHRLVAVAFLGNPQKGFQINHKDGNRQNNHADNLEWGKPKGPGKNYSVIQMNKDGKIVATYKNAKEAEEKNKGYESMLIRACCRGTRKTHKGYIWKYGEKYAPPLLSTFKPLPELKATDLSDEEWRPIEGFDGYMVSNKGRVKSLNFKKAGEGILRPWKDKLGYLRVSMHKESKQKQALVHRLVAMAFVPGYQPGLEVNHKDESPSNPLPENLEWVTGKVNSNYGNHSEHLSIGRSKSTILQLSLDGKVIAKHRNGEKAAEALRSNGISKATRNLINDCCRGRFATAYGYKWRRVAGQFV